LVVSHKIYLVRLFCAPLPAAPRGNCSPVLSPPPLVTPLHVTALHSSIGVSQTLRHGPRNEIKKLLYRAPPIGLFGRAAITLGIGPHSSLWSPYVIGQTIYIFILFMVALRSRCGHYIFALWFLSIFLSFIFYSSPNLSRQRLDVYHTSTHGVALVRI